MHTNPVVLIVTARAGNFDGLRRAVSEGGYKCEARRADDVLTGLARVAGGGVKLVLVDVSGGQDNAAKLESVRKFRAAAPGLPVAMWSDSEDPSLPAIASEAGATGWVTNGNSPQELARILSGALGNGAAAGAEASETLATPANATIIAVMGVKGGVGATTVAMNVAAALTERGRVILAEIRPMFGSLQAHFHPGRTVRGFTSRRNRDVAGTGTRAATSLLWPVPTVAGLRVLFGPQTGEDCGEIDAAGAIGLLHELAADADFVVVDLPASLSRGNRAVFGASHYLTLVVEPVPTCVTLGRLILEAIQGWEKPPPSIGTVVVKHNSEGTPIPLTEIEAELGVPIHSVVPPAAELWLQCEQARVPLIQCDPDGLVADSFFTLARCFHSSKRLRQ